MLPFGRRGVESSEREASSLGYVAVSERGDRSDPRSTPCAPSRGLRPLEWWWSSSSTKANERDFRTVGVGGAGHLIDDQEGKRKRACRQTKTKLLRPAPGSNRRSFPATGGKRDATSPAGRTNENCVNARTRPRVRASRAGEPFGITPSRARHHSKARWLRRWRTERGGRVCSNVASDGATFASLGRFISSASGVQGALSP